MLAFPIDCDTPSKRTEYAYRAQELLRLIHNVMGKWYKEGIPKTLWDRLPLKIKNKYPYKAQLAKASWQDFLIDFFEPRSNSISDAIVEQRALLKQSDRWVISKEDTI